MKLLKVSEKLREKKVRRVKCVKVQQSSEDFNVLESLEVVN